MYKLLYPDGSYSLGGMPNEKFHNFNKGYIVGDLVFPSSKKGKLWNLKSHIKNHLRILEHYDYAQHKMISDADKINGSIVIEYELVEKRRIPIEEFMKEE